MEGTHEIAIVKHRCGKEQGKTFQNNYLPILFLDAVKVVHVDLDVCFSKVEVLCSEFVVDITFLKNLEEGLTDTDVGRWPCEATCAWHPVCLEAINHIGISNQSAPSN